MFILGAGCVGNEQTDSQVESQNEHVLKIFHAGSLTAPFEALETKFEAAIMFMELLMSKEGQDVFLNLGLTPIVPPVSNNDGRSIEKLRLCIN